MKLKKYKIGRRLGASVFDKCQTQKFALSEQKRGSGRPKRRKQISDYGFQLLEKQKVRFTYGLKEKQLVNYMKEVMSKKGVNVYDELYKKLESRLDNVVYRFGLAETRAKARQMVSHGHIVVNGKKLNIPSYSVNLGETVGIRAQSQGKALFENLEEKIKNSNIPTWLSFDIKKKQGKVVGVPKMMDGKEFNLRQVFEYYSR